jgi:hypothetical protein
MIFLPLWQPQAEDFAYDSFNSIEMIAQPFIYGSTTMLISDLEHLASLSISSPKKLNGGILELDGTIFSLLTSTLLSPLEIVVTDSLAIPVNQSLAINGTLNDGTLFSTSSSSSIMTV